MLKYGSIFFIWTVFSFILASDTGPYKLIFRSILPYCNKTHTRVPVMNDPPKLNVELYNRTLVRGNVTFAKTYSGVKMSGALYRFENGNWLPTYKVPGIGCHRVLVRMIAEAFKVKVDYQTCAIIKGFYKFDKVPMARLMHLWQSEAEYGDAYIVVQISNQKYYLACFGIEASVVPLK